MTEEEFSQKIKQKYPQYSSLSDKDLTKKIVEKYPNYASQIDKKPGIIKEVGNTILDVAKNLPSAAKQVATQAIKQPLKTGQDVVLGLADVGPAIVNSVASVTGVKSRLPLLGKTFRDYTGTQNDVSSAIQQGATTVGGYEIGKGITAPLKIGAVKKNILGDVLGGQLISDETSLKNRAIQAGFDTAFGVAENSGSIIKNIRGKNPINIPKDIPIQAPIPEVKPKIKVGSKEVDVSEDIFNKFKETETQHTTNVNNIKEQIKNVGEDRVKKDYLIKQLNKEINNFEKSKRDLTGEYTSSELSSLIKKNRADFEKVNQPKYDDSGYRVVGKDEVLPNGYTTKMNTQTGEQLTNAPYKFKDTRTDSQIIDEIRASKKVPPETLNTINDIPKQEIPKTNKFNTPEEEIFKRQPGLFKQQEEVFAKKVKETTPEYMEDVANGRIKDPELTQEGAFSLLEQKYMKEGNMEGLRNIKRGYINIQNEARGLGLAGLGDGKMGAVRVMSRIEEEISNTMKKNGIDLDKMTVDGIEEIKNKVAKGKNQIDALDDFIDGITCK